MAENYYEKFYKKSSAEKAVNKAKIDRRKFNKERDKYFDEKRRGIKRGLDSEQNFGKDFNSERKGGTDHEQKSEYSKKDFNPENRHSEKSRSEKTHSEHSEKNVFEKDAEIVSIEKMFEFTKLTKESRNILENFDNIVQGIRPLNSRQFVQLPKDIRNLSHQLTDERGSRRVGYMNANEELSAYVRYFTWWNLVRFTRVFSNLPQNAFNLNDGDFCLDLGSGPLTVVTALWLSRPELREKKLTWYCLDLSAATMSLGEDIYLSVAAKTAPKNEDVPPHWNIIRVKGGNGTSLKNKVSFISCANMYNELSQNLTQNPEDVANLQIKQLLDYATENPSVFIAEPGMPVSAHFISLMRNQFIRKNFEIVSPCPHHSKCAMSGFHARYGGSAKWCNFDFSTENAPQRLLKLSKDSGLPKERAVISFMFAKKTENNDKTPRTENNRRSEKNAGNSNNCPMPENDKIAGENEMTLRIASDAIRIPEKGFGYYACGPKGLALVINRSGKKLESGDKIKISIKKSADILPKDKKSGATEIMI